MKVISKPVPARLHGSISKLVQQITGPKAWTSSSIQRNDWIVSATQSVQNELEDFVDDVRSRPLPILMLRAENYKLDACHKIIQQVRTRLDTGIGFAILDGLDIDDFSIEEIKSIYWILGQLLSNPVATKWDGTMLYDVTDTGQEYSYGVRGAATNVELTYHNDNSYGIAVPDYVSLMCLRAAQTGGLTSLCSLHTAHNILLKTKPELTNRLYDDFIFDRQAEHHPNDPKTWKGPVFRWDGLKLYSRVASSLIFKGYEIADAVLDAIGKDALEEMDNLMKTDQLSVRFPMERGQIQYLNNSCLAHHRSAFKDGPNQGQKRHLLRMWYRETGKKYYDG